MSKNIRDTNCKGKSDKKTQIMLRFGVPKTPLHDLSRTPLQIWENEQKRDVNQKETIK